MEPFPEQDFGQLKLLGDDYTKSIDPEDVREDLKNELLTLHSAFEEAR